MGDLTATSPVKLAESVEKHFHSKSWTMFLKNVGGAEYLRYLLKSTNVWSILSIVVKNSIDEKIHDRV